MKCWLHRRGCKTPWEFSGKPEFLLHHTKRGKIYRIINYGPIPWIAKDVGIDHWIDATTRIRADWIEFDDGGKYVFPRKGKRR